MLPLFGGQRCQAHFGDPQAGAVSGEDERPARCPPLDMGRAPQPFSQHESRGSRGDVRDGRDSRDSLIQSFLAEHVFTHGPTRRGLLILSPVS